MYRIINKINGKKLSVDFCPTLKNLVSYFGKSYLEWIEIPYELWDKDIEIVNGKVVLKAIDVQLLKQEIISIVNKKIEENKNFKFVQKINIADGRIISVLTDLLDSTLSSWVLLKNKAIKNLLLEDDSTVEVRYVMILNNDNGKEDFVPITEEEINRLQSLITNSIDTLQFAKINVSNKINSASDEEIIKIFSMSDEERQKFISNLIMDALVS